MQIRNDAATKIANEGCFSNRSASTGSTDPIENPPSLLTGGVCGSVSE